MNPPNTPLETLRTWRSYALVSFAVLLFAFIVSSILLSKNLGSLTDSASNRYQSYILANELRQSSDDLTRMARTFVATGDARFEKQFRSVLAIRNGEQPRPNHYNHIYWDFLAAFDGHPLEHDLTDKKRSLHNLMIEQGFSADELELLKEAQNQLILL